MEINNCEIKGDEILFKNTKCQRIPLSLILNIFFSLDGYKTYRVRELYEYTRCCFNINLHKTSFLSLFNNKEFVLFEDVSSMIKSIFKNKKFKNLKEMINFLFVNFNYLTLSIIMNYGFDFLLSVFKYYFQKREDDSFEIIEKLLNSKEENEWINLLKDSKLCFEYIDNYLKQYMIKKKNERLMERIVFKEVHKDNLSANLKFLCSDSLYSEFSLHGKQNVSDLINSKVGLLIDNVENKKWIQEIYQLEETLKESLIVKFNTYLNEKLTTGYYHKAMTMPILDRLIAGKKYIEISRELKISRERPRRVHYRSCNLFASVISRNSYMLSFFNKLTFDDPEELYKSINPYNPELIKILTKFCVTYSSKLKKYVLDMYDMVWCQDNDSDLLMSIYRYGWNKYDKYDKYNEYDEYDENASYRGTFIEFLDNNKKYLRDVISKEHVDQYLEYIIDNQIYAKGYTGISREDIFELMFDNYVLSGNNYVLKEDNYKKRKLQKLSNYTRNNSKIKTVVLTETDRFLHVLNQVCPNKVKAIDDKIILKFIQMYPYYFKDEISKDFVCEMCQKVKYYNDQWKMNTLENDLAYMNKVREEWENFFKNNLDHFYNILNYYDINTMDINDSNFLKSFQNKVVKKDKDKEIITLDIIKEKLKYLMKITDESQCVNPANFMIKTFSYDEYKNFSNKYKDIDFNCAPVQFRKIVQDDGYVFLILFNNNVVGHYVIADVTNKRKYWITRKRKIYYPVEFSLQQNIASGNAPYVIDRLIGKEMKRMKIN